MGRYFKFALIAALPVEILNLNFLGIPVSVGVPASAPWYSEVLGNVWFYMHLPSIMAMDRFGFLQSQPDFGPFVIFLSGYLGTALLLFAALLCLHGLRHLARTYLLRRV